MIESDVGNDGDDEIAVEETLTCPQAFDGPKILTSPLLATPHGVRLLFMYFLLTKFIYW